LIEQIDAMGGSVAAIESGFMQNKIAESAYAYQKNIESQQKIIVGVNQFQSKESQDMPVFKVDESIRLQQIEKLKILKSKRDAQKVSTCLATIKLAAHEGTNLMPPVIDAVENYCTLGEISDVLRNVFGEYQA
jgi:methylmalonyl-CoA mutase N-terminal domain/subunit